MRVLFILVVAATLLPPTVSAQSDTSWLDRPPAAWSHAPGAVPQARAGTASAAAETVRKAGWAPFLHFDRAIARDDIEILGGMTAAASPGCEPTTFNLFVFVGGIFAGTISPIVMGHGRDGVVGAVRVTGPDAVTAEFARYTTKDTECCPTSRVRVTYRIERAGPQRTLVPVDIRTLR
jgi:hypothetical protein